jgi:hypothetical protein
MFRASDARVSSGAQRRASLKNSIVCKILSTIAFCSGVVVFKSATVIAVTNPSKMLRRLHGLAVD